MKDLVFALTVILISSYSTNEKVHRNYFKSNTAKQSQSDSIDLYTHSIKGDFDGDGIKEKLVSFISDSNNKPVIKVPVSEDWGETIDYIFKNGITTKLYIENKKTDTLELGSSMGVYCLINLGDLNSDKKDEIILVADWPDYSNWNHARIYTLCNGKWKEIKTFGINEGIAFDWEGDKRPIFNDIPGFLVIHDGKWINADYNDEDYSGRIESMKKLIIPKCK